MTIEINENILLGIAGAVFIPVFIFCVKMIMEVTGINGKVDIIKSDLEELKVKINYLEQLERENPVQKLKIEQLQKEIEELKQRIRDHDRSANKTKNRLIDEGE